MAQVVVLIHLSRSGSTLLSRLLDELQDVGVTLEGAIPDGLTVPWIEITDPASLDRALDGLYAQQKYSHWGVDRADLRRRLVEAGFPVSYRTWLSTILDACFSDRPGLKAHIYKRGPYAYRLGAFRRQFPDAKVIAILRDPRGALCSQSRRIQTLDVRRFAKGYSRFVGAVRADALQPWMHVVRYEDLVAEPEAQIGEIAAFLEVDPGRRRTSGYAGTIPQGQSHLHDRLTGAVNPNIADEWRGQLDRLSVLCVEHLCRDSMAAAGYEPANPPLGPMVAMALVWWFRLKRPFGHALRLTGLGGGEEASHAWRRLLNRSRRPRPQARALRGPATPAP